MKLTGQIEIEVPDDDDQQCSLCRFYDDPTAWCNLFYVFIGVNLTTGWRTNKPIRCKKCLVTFTRKTEKELTYDV